MEHETSDRRKRCDWSSGDPLLLAYHDVEWGVPVHEDNLLFEFLTLEGAQAGLSWLTILRKRENYRIAFDHFDPRKVSAYDEKRVQQLLQNDKIIRNRLKIISTIQNAKAFLTVREEFGSFDKYIWSFVEDKPKTNRWSTLSQLPAKTRESDAMSHDLGKRGFKFAGSTICYAFMQAIGMVNDHQISCFRYKEIMRSDNTHTTRKT